MNINPNPAITIEAKQSDTFEEWAKKISEKSHIALRQNGKDPKELYLNPDDENKVWKVELLPDSCYPIIALLTKYIANPEQFVALMPYIEKSLTEAVMDGVIEEDFLQDIRTLFNIKTPAIPERFDNDVPKKLFLCGDLYLVVEEVPVQPEFEHEPQTEEEPEQPEPEEENETE